jgi:hypothetical protein
VVALATLRAVSADEAAGPRNRRAGGQALSANVTETPAAWKFTEQGDDAIECLGWDALGQVGDGSTTDNAVPINVEEV